MAMSLYPKVNIICFLSCTGFCLNADFSDNFLKLCFVLLEPSGIHFIIFLTLL